MREAAYLWGQKMALLGSSVTLCHLLFLFASLSSSIHGNNTAHLAKLELAIRNKELGRMQVKLPFLYIKNGPIVGMPCGDP